MRLGRYCRGGDSAFRSELLRVTRDRELSPVSGWVRPSDEEAPDIRCPIIDPRTMLDFLMSITSVGVMLDASTIGFGLIVTPPAPSSPAAPSGLISDAHCGGSPTNLPSRASNPVWTRCSKLLGMDMIGFFFFLENMLSVLLLRYLWLCRKWCNPSSNPKV